MPLTRFNQRFHLYLKSKHMEEPFYNKTWWLYCKWSDYAVKRIEQEVKKFSKMDTANVPVLFGVHLRFSLYFFFLVVALHSKY